MKNARARTFPWDANDGRAVPSFLAFRGIKGEIGQNISKFKSFWYSSHAKGFFIIHSHPYMGHRLNEHLILVHFLTLFQHLFFMDFFHLPSNS
jgi:hypothetical protein